MGALPKKRSISFLSDDELGAQNNDWYRIVTEFNIQFATVTKLPLFFLPAETCNSQELGTPEPGGISSLALSPIFFMSWKESFCRTCMYSFAVLAAMKESYWSFRFFYQSKLNTWGHPSPRELAMPSVWERGPRWWCTDCDSIPAVLGAKAARLWAAEHAVGFLLSDFMDRRWQNIRGDVSNVLRFVWKVWWWSWSWWLTNNLKAWDWHREF